VRAGGSTSRLTGVVKTCGLTLDLAADCSGDHVSHDER
jgi:hypothetical protein